MISDYQGDFVLQSREHLTTFEQALLALEKARSEEEISGHIDRSLRAIHSLKGDAGFLGFDTLRSLAHAMESLLESFRGGARTLPLPVVEALLAARDQLAALVDDLDHSHSADIGDMLARLSAMGGAFGGTSLDIDIDLAERSTAAAGRLGAFLKGLAALGTLHGQQVIVSGSIEDAVPSGPVRLVARLHPLVPPETVERVLGKAAPRRPSARALAKQEERWLGDASAGSPAQSMPQVSPGGASNIAASMLAVPTKPRDTAEHRPSPDPRDTPPAATSTRPAADSERLSSLRVHVDLLDRLMTLVGELTLVRNQSLLAFVQEEGSRRAIIQRLNSVTSELQDTVLRTRMQPVGNLFGKFPRMVRDLARQLGKQVEVVTIGREVELDKSVLEQLSDPLTHLIRNSIDHGIESPEERVSRGKSPTGKIILSATPADGQVRIEIRDDGRGIDPAAIKAKALDLRVRTEAELDRLSSKELLSLILLPGFSTARNVTDVSGRGVGMDVVKTNVDQLEGSLAIDSTLGQGTSMQLRVPLTLAIIPCLIVDVGDQRYAVPQRELEEVVCLHPGGKGAIEQAFDSEVFRLRNRLLPIVRFREVLERAQPFTAATKAELLRKYNPSERDPRLIEYIVVLRSGGRRFGLLVDEVRGTQDVVVKPMHATMKRLGVFAGATLMGDGRVALIANVDGIVEHARCFGAELRTESTAATRDPGEVHRVLIFEYGPREQFVLPLVQIRRIESLPVQRIEFVGDDEFVLLDGVATRIVRPDRVLNVSPCPEQSVMFLVLPKFVPEPLGILISRIVDTDSLSIDLQQATVADAGVLGTATIRGKLSLFIDIQYIRERVFGKTNDLSHEGHSATSPGSPADRRVLLVDDTPFFREIVKRYLESDGIAVTTAVDGQDGLNKLASGQFDAIVSDIEMPVLDGWDFAQAVRERGCRLPLLALTSLSKAEHESRARHCGFDEFEEKLDHDRLLRTVRRLLNPSR